MKEKILPLTPLFISTVTSKIAEYPDGCAEENDPDLLLTALSNVAKARGMAQLARDAGLGRESLWLLTPGAKPRFETILKCCDSLGVKLTAHPA
ncbi:MAG: putative addiction module antidote protein [Candidatus Competibacteraceae bacterium]|nr:putative addiction module antidote protein [Candidatus Competibacteraceae bacterium]